MFPYVYQSASLTIGSYGTMLAIAYLVGRHLYLKNLARMCNQPINSELLIVCLLIFGVIGAKLMYVFKNPDLVSFSDINSIVSGSGFSSQGAILAAILVIILFARFSNVSLSILLDAAAPAAVMAYAIARIGCFLAGDDCYGVPSDLPWAMAFPHGIKPTTVSVHPVPLYEIAYSVAIWYWLKTREKANFMPYSQFFMLLLSWGACRFLVEFVSTNPIKIWGMSGSQFGALLMFIAGAVFLFRQQLSSTQKKAG